VCHSHRGHDIVGHRFRDRERKAVRDLDGAGSARRNTRLVRHRTDQICGPDAGAAASGANVNEHKQNIVTTLNELGKAITDIGLIAALHQHTGTAVETRDETYWFRTLRCARL
jgi:hypothetical protein